MSRGTLNMRDKSVTKGRDKRGRTQFVTIAEKRSEELILRLDGGGVSFLPW